MTLRSMFNTVAEKYDLANKIMSLGLDRIWREECAKKSTPGNVIVDLCCGTGDLSYAILKYAPPNALLLGLDFNMEMLKGALKKKQAYHHTKKGAEQEKTSSPSYILADAAHLPLRRESVDTVSTAFGLRNLTYRNPQAEKHLAELTRILHKDGRFVCVETSQPNNHLQRILLHLYFLHYVPLIGWLISKRKEAYQYLGFSAANFKTAEEVSAMLIASGFREASFKHLTLGAVALFTATK